MTEITASTVRNLRQETSAGMMDCKRALQENDGNVVAAKAWLRKKGLAGAQAKASRSTDQGLVAIAVERDKGRERAAVVLELNAETDFVARNTSFQAFLHKIALRALEVRAHDVETLLATSLAPQNKDENKDEDKNEETVEQALQSLIGTIGENMRLRRCACLIIEQGTVATYTHGRILIEDFEPQRSGESSVEVSLGTIGVALALEANFETQQLEDTGKALAMHIAAAKPLVVSRADLPAETVRQEEEILREQAEGAATKGTGAKGTKADDILAKIVRGRMEKFFRNVVLDEQLYALDETRSVASMLKEAGQKDGEARVKGFLRLALGEQS